MATVAISLLAAFEYTQIANLQRQKNRLGSEASSYRSEVANYGSLSGLNYSDSEAIYQAWTPRLQKLENLAAGSALAD